ncbi:MAG: hypothetical protein A3F18_01770 [Legionellales bacterium RIFCSPHIGHO2_12_FULL_37_14]|nr:MAG: hypothetical protein A3F18_01770 [Legionellales bacterium RIFCSPHIGHO2_12_FULL_37_14]
MSTLEIQDLSKTKKGQIILHPLNVCLDKGEFVAIIGPSGSGKSTLLRIIAGLEEASSGVIRINGKSVSALSPAKRDIAMVFQDYALYPHMSVFDNIAYSLKMRKYPKDDIKISVEYVAERLGLTKYLLQKPESLSGGQKQRVAMGRALVRTPSLYLFDEPLSNLDVALRLQLRLEIKQLHKSAQITSLYVTHDQIEAMTLASRIIILNHGRIEQFATPRQIYLKPANVFVGSFMGLHPMNLFSGNISLRDKTIRLRQQFTISLPQLEKDIPDNEKVIVGIRPEEVKVLYDDKSPGLNVQEVLVDEMGTDLLIRVQCEATKDIYTVRQSVKEKFNKSIKKIAFDSFYGHLFLASTGERIGGFHEKI